MKSLVSLLIAVSLIVLGVPVLRANAQDISNTPSSYLFSTISENETKETGLDYFAITNTSNVSVNITIGGTNITGGVPCEVSDTATSGENTYGLMAGLELGSYSRIVRQTGPFQTLVCGLTASGNQKILNATLDTGCG